MDITALAIGAGYGYSLLNSSNVIDTTKFQPHYVSTFESDLTENEVNSVNNAFFNTDKLSNKSDELIHYLKQKLKYLKKIKFCI
jgi:hypothetical protein